MGDRFKKIGYEDFRRFAGDPAMSKYEKIGFPDAYRQGHEPAILDDIVGKLRLGERRHATVLDIGCGCSDLPRLLSEFTAAHAQRLILVDSAEMLKQLPDASHVRKLPGRFPDVPALAGEVGLVDAVVAYSVFQYIFQEANVHAFLDAAVGLLAPGGRLLIGDIPNYVKRARFFASAAGQAFHRQFAGAESLPDAAQGVPRPGEIDDGVLLGLLSRYRAFGFDAYLLPQDPTLPMANRREDLLIERP